MSQAYNATHGAGQLQKRRALLQAFVVGKCSIRAECFCSLLVEFSERQSKQASRTWVPWHKIIEHFGQAEAERRLEQGLLPRRRCADNAEFWEFELTIVTESETKEWSSSVQATKKTRLDAKELTGLSSHFSAQEVAGQVNDELPDDLLKLIGKKKAKPVLKVGDGSGDEDKAQSSTSRRNLFKDTGTLAANAKTAAQATKALASEADKCSKIGKGDPAEQVQLSARKMHSLLSKANLDYKTALMDCKRANQLFDESCHNIMRPAEAGLKTMIPLIERIATTVTPEAKMPDAKTTIVEAASIVKITAKATQFLRDLMA